MIFPALVFALGFSFFIHTWVRHRGLSILILLVVFGVFLFQLGKVREGLLIRSGCLYRMLFLK